MSIYPHRQGKIRLYRKYSSHNRQKGEERRAVSVFYRDKSPGKIYFSIMPDSWYMLDEKYIYIYVYRSETVIMKAKLT